MTMETAIGLVQLFKLYELEVDPGFPARGGNGNGPLGFIHTKRTRKRHCKQMGCIVFYATVHTKYQRKNRFSIRLV